MREYSANSVCQMCLTVKCRFVWIRIKKIKIDCVLSHENAPKKKKNEHEYERAKQTLVATHVFVPILRRHVIQLNAQQSGRIKVENENEDDVNRAPNSYLLCNQRRLLTLYSAAENASLVDRADVSPVWFALMD